MTSNASVPLIVTDINRHFRAAKMGIPLSGVPKVAVDAAMATKPLAGHERDYASYPDIAIARGALQGHSSMTKEANALNISFGQPNFFSPVYTPINWQIPSKRREVYQWSRFFYENEPRVAAAIDFYSRFPLSSDFQIECSDRYVRQYFEKVCEKIELRKWLRIISHEVHLLGDCFPFLEVDCEYCHGSGQYNGQVCEHEGGSFKRLVVLNPDFIEVFTNSLSAENSICLIPDDELKQMAKTEGGRSRLAPNIAKMAMEGQPIPLDNLCVSHLKYGESGYRRYGISMIRRLFPILAYKTKLMTAQWIVAERMIIPIKIVKVGSEDRPASPMDIANVQAQLQATANDPNLVLVTHHAFDMNWVGASGQVLQLSTEWEFINQEILDGLGINKSLLNAEGPVYASAAIGAEVMIKRLDEWRNELSRWAVNRIFAPISKMMGFVKENEWGEKVYIVPKIRWNALNLRDVNQERQNLMTLYDKGVISRRRLLDEFQIDSDQEAEQIRYERIESLADAPAGGAGGGAPGGGGGGGLEGALGGGGGLDLGGGGTPPDLGGGGAPGGMEGGAPPPAGGASAASMSTSRNAVNIADYGNKVMKEKSRRKVDSFRSKGNAGGGDGGGDDQQPGGDGFKRDEKGRIWRTSLEIKLQKGMEDRRRSGRIVYPWTSQLEVKVGVRPYLMDFAFPYIKLDVEADGGTFHSSEEQVARDQKRDNMLRQAGWTVIRFQEDDIEKNIGAVLDRIEKEITRKSELIKRLHADKARISGGKG